MPERPLGAPKRSQNAPPAGRGRCRWRRKLFWNFSYTSYTVALNALDWLRLWDVADPRPATRSYISYTRAMGRDVRVCAVILQGCSWCSSYQLRVYLGLGGFRPFSLPFSLAKVRQRRRLSCTDRNRLTG